jgi:hypothetical protein
MSKFRDWLQNISFNFVMIAIAILLIVGTIAILFQGDNSDKIKSVEQEILQQQHRIEFDRVALELERRGSDTLSPAGMGVRYRALQDRFFTDTGYSNQLNVDLKKLQDEQNQVVLRAGLITLTAFLTLAGAVPLARRALFDTGASTNTKATQRLEAVETGASPQVENLRLREELARCSCDLTETRAALTDDQKIFAQFMTRMNQERDRIRGTSYANLLFGLSFSIVALATLGYPLIANGTFVQNGGGLEFYFYLVQRFLPRISVGILIQIVGFFFLRLYVANEADLKHTKNEITNFEAWMIAVLAAKGAELSLREKVLERMISTERNFILNKGQKTASSDLDAKYNDMLELMKAVIARWSAPHRE